MSAIDLNEKIKILPEDLRKQVDDFVDFLISKYKKNSLESENTTDDFTPEELELLDFLWKEHEENPKDVMTIEQLRKETAKRYGL